MEFREVEGKGSISFTPGKKCASHMGEEGKGRRKNHLVLGEGGKTRSQKATGRKGEELGSRPQGKRGKTLPAVGLWGGETGERGGGERKECAS